MNKTIITGLLLLVLCPSVLADPIALRNNITDKNTTGISIGWKETTIGTWISPYLGLSAEISLPFNTISASVATRTNLSGRGLGFGTDFFISSGLTFTTIENGLAFSLTPALRARYKWESFSISAGIVSPTLFQVSKKIETRIPALIEISFLLGLNENKASIGLQADGGVIFVPGLSPSLDLQGSLLFNFF